MDDMSTHEIEIPRCTVKWTPLAIPKFRNKAKSFNLNVPEKIHHTRNVWLTLTTDACHRNHKITPGQVPRY